MRKIFLLIGFFLLLISCESQLNDSSNRKNDPSVKTQPIAIPLESIEIIIDDIIYIGEEYYLDINLYPANTTETELVYISSDNNILIIDENGKITPCNKGEAIINVQSVDGIIANSKPVLIYQIVKKPSIINISEEWGPYEKIEATQSNLIGINNNVEITINNFLYIDYLQIDLAGKISTNNTEANNTFLGYLYIKFLSGTQGIIFNDITALTISLDMDRAGREIYSGKIFNSTIDTLLYSPFQYNDIEFEISGNIFKKKLEIYTANLWSIQNYPMHYPIIKNNLIIGQFIFYYNPELQDFENFYYNSININTVSFGLHTPKINFANNYWYTTNTALIDEFIIDKNDILSLGYYINYLPILTEKHPLTPDLDFPLD